MRTSLSHPFHIVPNSFAGAGCVDLASMMDGKSRIYAKSANNDEAQRPNQIKIEPAFRDEF